jgi:hypothetical protein
VQNLLISSAHQIDPSHLSLTHSLTPFPSHLLMIIHQKGGKEKKMKEEETKKNSKVSECCILLLIFSFFDEWHSRNLLK